MIRRLLALIAIGVLALVLAARCAVERFKDPAPPGPIGDLFIRDGPRGPGSRDTKPISRFCGISTPTPILPALEFTLQVLLTDDRKDPLFESAVAIGDSPEVTMELPLLAPGAISWDVDVTVAVPKFEFLGSNESVLRLGRSGTSTPAQFRLRAPARFVPGSPYRALVTYSRGGRFLARSVHDLPVEGSTRSEQPSSPRSSAKLARGGKSPHLTVILSTLEETDADTLVRVEIRSPHLRAAYEDVTIPVDMAEWLSRELSDSGALPTRGKPPPTAEVAGINLRGIGRQLYRRFAPRLFREAFWRVLDLRGEKFETIQIITDDPSLPFELMCPVRPDGSGERDFLGVDFTVARLHLERGPGIVSAPALRVPLNALTTIAPSYGGDRELPEQRRELEVLRRIRQFREIEPSLSGMVSLFQDPPNGIIHFAGHGVEEPAGESSTYRIELETDAFNLLTFRGLARGTDAQMFFFLNACSMGGAHRIASFVDGWAPAALEYGASGMIGPLWPVTDRAAADVSEMFYEELRDRHASGEPFQAAAALRRVRASYAESKDPSFLAYVFYGDPALTIHAP